MFDGFFNSVFGGVIAFDPTVGIIFISFILTIMITLVYKFMTDQNMLKGLKDQIKQHQKEMKDLKDDPKKMMEVQKKSMQVNMEYMKHSFKPMLFTFLPIIIIFGWVRTTYELLPVQFLFIKGWIWVYILSSILFSTVIRKALKIY